MHPKSAIPNAILIHTYAALRQWLDGYRTGNLNLIFLMGRPGLGKSRLIREALQGHESLFLEGHATPLQTYALLYRNRDRLVVIDDEDSFHAEPIKIRLMKCLCSTEPAKRLAWESTSKLLKEMALPTEFSTTSKVAVLTNRLSSISPDLSALLDRGSVLSFEPTAAEIHG
jgi:hypothetical protein